MIDEGDDYSDSGLAANQSASDQKRAIDLTFTRHEKPNKNQDLIKNKQNHQDTHKEVYKRQLDIHQ
ncbi:hypothetical protein ECA4078 [Pectobacterium atrosepticum SCRI1043]|uniref:Uncharacterized protein n=1 Tax=Pectobacterium atrosepticum (strain SCRI 1043 / ATCC BAA-672) TaxID=218491 RepID=Q6CZS3_PECAS|nr:hypothetical protein [Pectobacterium atrosepticum]AIA72853.1 hypothetical protein EV46_20295 [Pectobacterium atrosepticum]ATY92521.1 hypothetical protein CVS35_20290 [Pectobacterium atrosepticum]KMK78702.1 hypothetical protein KCQ_20219 [Pectobacterium atrosepticum ICMP 1526]MBL0895543.1 hypothetical protein [Pectobacterium atrosepticum]MCA6979816.1 hypothetical protein [Pectobacterium atrosepticum]